MVTFLHLLPRVRCMSSLIRLSVWWNRGSSSGPVEDSIIPELGYQIAVLLQASRTHRFR